MSSHCAGTKQRKFGPRLWPIRVLDDAEQNRERMRVAAPGPMDGRTGYADGRDAGAARPDVAVAHLARLIGSRPSGGRRGDGIWSMPRGRRDAAADGDSFKMTVIQ
jgi:hypothetical protein